MLKISSAPHIHTTKTVPNVMKDVVIALLPAGLAAIVFFGLSALLIIITSVASCVLFEYFFGKYVFKTGNSTTDYSAIITGLLLAYNLPSNFPLFFVLIGSFVAIVVTKMCYGGLGKNIFNPALVGRVFLFISFPVAMSRWPQPHFLDFFNMDAQTAATPLGILKHIDASTSATSLTTSASDLPEYWQMFVGYTGGSLGEVSSVALLLGFIYMLYRKVIRWHIPFYYIGTVFILTGITWLITKDVRYEPITHILSGGLMLGAIFMATDYTTSPMSLNGKIFFAICCGVLTVVIRLFSGYPEGVSFAILIMNAFVPLIDRFFVPHHYGAKK